MIGLNIFNDKLDYQKFFSKKFQDINDYFDYLIDFFNEQHLKEKKNESIKSQLNLLYKKKVEIKKNEDSIIYLFDSNKKEGYNQFKNNIINSMQIIKKLIENSQKYFIKYQQVRNVSEILKKEFKEKIKIAEKNIKNIDEIIKRFDNKKFYDICVLKNSESKNIKLKDKNKLNKDVLFKDKEYLEYIFRRNLSKKGKKIFKTLIINKNKVNLLIINRVNDKEFMKIISKNIDEYIKISNDESKKNVNKDDIKRKNDVNKYNYFLNLVNLVNEENFLLYNNILIFLQKSIENCLINTNLVNNTNVNLTITFNSNKNSLGIYNMKKSTFKDVYISLTITDELFKYFYHNHEYIPIKSELSQTIIHEITHAFDSLVLNFEIKNDDLMDYGVTNIIQKLSQIRNKKRFKKLNFLNKYIDKKGSLYTKELENIKSDMKRSPELFKFYLMNIYQKIFFYTRTEGLAIFSEYYSEHSLNNSKNSVVFLNYILENFINNKQIISSNIKELYKNYTKEKKIENNPYFNKFFSNIYQEEGKSIHNHGLSMFFFMFISKYNYDIYETKYSKFSNEENIFLDLNKSYLDISDFKNKNKNNYKKLKINKIKILTKKNKKLKYFIIDSKENLEKNMYNFMKKVNIMKLSGFFKEYEKACSKLKLKDDVFNDKFLSKVVKKEMSVYKKSIK